MKVITLLVFNKYSINFIVKLFLQREKVIRVEDFEVALRAALVCLAYAFSLPDAHMGGNPNELNIYIEHSHLYKNRCDARNNIGNIGKLLLLKL